MSFVTAVLLRSYNRWGEECNSEGYNARIQIFHIRVKHTALRVLVEGVGSSKIREKRAGGSTSQSKGIGAERTEG